jgi:energy-coupling factor transporter ATP-binding protein EcfA2
MKLLLEFASRHYGKVCTKLTLEDLTADMVCRFLNYLEQVRHNSVPTRNVRLVAIHSFFQYLATIDPRHLAQSQSILGVQFKRRAHRIPEYSIRDVRAQLAVVLQHPHIFNTSIRENLLIARPEATDSELIEALEKAGLASFVQNLPRGLQTIPGSEGSTLSGGQRQRLALAQAFLKEAPILVLDEATANLDPETECDILDRVFQLTTDRTLIAITHRPEKQKSCSPWMLFSQCAMGDWGVFSLGSRVSAVGKCQRMSQTIPLSSQPSSPLRTLWASL